MDKIGQIGRVWQFITGFLAFSPQKSQIELLRRRKALPPTEDSAFLPLHGVPPVFVLY
jgi:hypothetical protein